MSANYIDLIARVIDRTRQAEWVYPNKEMADDNLMVAVTDLSLHIECLRGRIRDMQKGMGSEEIPMLLLDEEKDAYYIKYVEVQYGRRNCNYCCCYRIYWPYHPAGWRVAQFSITAAVRDWILCGANAYPVRCIVCYWIDE